MTWFDEYAFSWLDHPSDTGPTSSIDTVITAKIKAALAICGNPATSYDVRTAHRFDADLAPFFFADLKKHCSAFTIASCVAASCAGRLPDRDELRALSAYLSRTKFMYFDLQPGAFDLGCGIEIKAFVLKTRHVMNERKPKFQYCRRGPS